MSSLLQRLEKKPIPADQVAITVMLPRAADGGTTAAIVDKTTLGYDRARLRERMARRGMTLPRRQRPEPKEPQAAVAPKEPRPPPAAPRPPPVKIKKRGRVRLSKRIKKGTITAVRGATPGVAQLEVEPTSVVVGAHVLQRPAPAPPVRIRASAYYMNNRQIFINFINSLFEPYKESLMSEANVASCDNKRKDFSLLTHQEIVRDYMNLYTPYRGLLLYHGLGAGKTCASIAIAEGMKNAKEVVIMTPASLRQNYIHELKVCGDSIYRLKQHWTFLPTGRDLAREKDYARALSVPQEQVTRQGGIWVMDVGKESNYESLGSDARSQLNAQIDSMISAKYRFINYNGLRDSHLDDLTEGGRRPNPFAGKVVIIDEAHNFVSRIVNKKGKKESLSVKLYEFLLSAEKCRVVFLTGTPMINYPNEIGVLFNMLRGYIRTFVFYLDVRTRRKINQKSIESLVRPLNVHDYVEYNASGKTLVMTRNPFGFVSERADGIYKGVSRNAQGDVDNATFVKAVTDVLRKNDIHISRVEQKTWKALPDTLEEFRTMFIDTKTGSIKNSNLLKRRIVGMTSYFRSAREELMPRFDPDEDLSVALVPMSDYQFGIYELARSKERDLEKRNARRRKKGSDGVYEDTISTYRIFSRAFCNFVFPRQIGRPMPHAGQDIGSAIAAPGADEDALDVVSLDEKIANVDGRYDQSDREALQAHAASDMTYESRITAALRALREGANKYLSPAGLEIYSPKFLAILNNIQGPEGRGLHLLYSQFRTLEGIGIFKLVLEENGFAQFKIKKNAAGLWELDIDPADRPKPKFALYTGTEDTVEKEIVRNVFNGAWDAVPSNLARQLRENDENNNNGEVIKVFMITSSGAEGITLRNVRFVHIMEPYWHPVRVEQVIGRARRICSHQDLPEEDRTVHVYMYLMKFTDAQLVPADVKGGMASNELLQKDLSKLDKTTPVTSDQTLYEISKIKQEISRQLLRAVKESAIDCAIHARKDDKDPLICLSFGAVGPNQFTTTPALTVEKEFDVQQARNLEKVTWKARAVTIGARKYAFKPDRAGASTGEIYDLDSYLRARRIGGAPILRGYLRRDEATKKIKFVPLAAAGTS